jgi:large subunit ribosomal protein L22
MNDFSVAASDPRARLDGGRARLLLDELVGLPADQALELLRFSPRLRCEVLARVLDEALATARIRYGTPADRLVLRGAEVRAGEPVVRVRRAAHGLAGWITTDTTSITVHVGPPWTPTDEEP